jgi:hypothetical protein
MHRRVLFLSVALAAFLAGNAYAGDATSVIYDLTQLQGKSLTKPDSPGHGDKKDGEGVETPHDQRDFGHEQGQGDGHDNDHRNDGDHRHDGDRGRDDDHGHDGDHRHGGHDDGGSDSGDERQGNPSPTPEPGTMLLLGGGLAAAARRFAKR